MKVAVGISNVCTSVSTTDIPSCCDPMVVPKKRQTGALTALTITVNTLCVIIKKISIFKNSFPAKNDAPAHIKRTEGQTRRA